MSRVLEETGCPIPSTDLYERGYGEAGHDFLNPCRLADNIVTNPPYNCAEGFVASGIKHARHKFALLLRLAFLEGANRANTIFANMPPARVWVFSERITFYPSGVKPRAPGLPLTLGLSGQGRARHHRTKMVQARIPGAIFVLSGSCATGKPKATGNRDQPAFTDGVARRVFVRRNIAHLLLPDFLILPSGRLRQIFRRESSTCLGFRQ